VLGPFLGAHIERRFTFGQVIVSIVWIQALLFPLYLFAPNVLLFGVVFAVVYLLAPLYNVVQFSYRVAQIPDRLQGRVNSVFRLEATNLPAILARVPHSELVCVSPLR